MRFDRAACPMVEHHKLLGLRERGNQHREGKVGAAPFKFEERADGNLIGRVHRNPVHGVGRDADHLTVADRRGRLPRCSSVSPGYEEPIPSRPVTSDLSLPAKVFEQPLHLLPL